MDLAVVQYLINVFHVEHQNSVPQFEKGEGDGKLFSYNLIQHPFPGSKRPGYVIPGKYTKIISK